MNLKEYLATTTMRIAGSMPLVLARVLGRALASIALLINTRECKTTRTNIRLCMPELDKEQTNQLTKQSIIETSKLAFEVAVVWQQPPSWLKQNIHAIHNEQLVIDAMQQKKGLIILAPHIGNWEVLGRHLPTYGRTTNLYQPPKQVLLEPFIKASRERSGAKLVPTNSRGVATLLKRLRAGEITGILPDQIPNSGGEFCPFFGHPAYTMALLHGLYQRTQCAIVVGAAIRVDNGFELHYLEPDARIYSEDLAESLVGLNKSVELAVALKPAQYQWEYKRFRKQPEGMREPY